MESYMLWFWPIFIKNPKIIKRSPEIAVYVKKYEILDFRGSFDNVRFFFNYKKL